MRILAISQYFPPDITAAAFRIHDMTAALHRRGHAVTVLTAFPHKGQAETADDHEEGPHLIRTAIADLGGGGMTSYLRHYFSFVRSSLAAGVQLWARRERFDVVYVSSPPLFVGITGYVLSRLFRKPLLLEVRDIWPDSAVAAGQISATGTAYRVGHLLERFMYRKAAAIVCVSKYMQAYIAGFTDRPVDVVYNGVPDSHLAATPEGPPPRTSGGKTLMYAGNFGRVQNLQILIRAFAEVRQAGHMADWKLFFVGGGAEEAFLKGLVAELGLGEHVEIMGALSREALRRRSAEVEALYIGLKQDDVLAKTIPSKVFDCLLLNRPIVASLEGEGAEILAESPANLCAAPGDLAGLKKALTALDAHYDDLARAAGGNRRIVAERFTRERSVDVLEGVMRQISKQQTGVLA